MVKLLFKPIVIPQLDWSTKICIQENQLAIRFIRHAGRTRNGQAQDETKLTESDTSALRFEDSKPRAEARALDCPSISERGILPSTCVCSDCWLGLRNVQLIVELQGSSMGMRKQFIFLYRLDN
jgi:hypothetical protein